METTAQLNARLRPLLAGYYDTGREALLGQVLEVLRPPLLRYACHTLGGRDADRAEDLVQDTLLGLVLELRARRFTLGNSLVSYAFTYCRHRFLASLENYAARTARPGADDDPFHLLGAAAATPADELALHAEHVAEAGRTVAAATGAVLDLPDPNARAAVVLRYYRGLPVPEAAAQLGVGEQLYRDRLGRGLAALRAWGQQHASPGPEVYACLPHLHTGDLFIEPTPPQPVKRTSRRGLAPAA